MEDFDLQCIICNKQPTFCDVSHLLTHVASKAHLANRFALDVRKATDARAAHLLETYERWHNANNLDQMLSARLAAKEQRRKRKSENTAMHLNAQAIHEPVSTNGPIGSNTLAALPVSDCIDPRLAGSYDGTHEENAISPITPTTWTAINSSRKTRSGPIRRSMRSSASATSNELKMKIEPNSDIQNLAMYPVTPTQPRRKKAAEEITWASDLETPEPIVDSAPRTQASGNVGKEKQTRARADEIARLKGVLWPGMDCFDAATDQMRRRRNQKKDGTVLKQMEIGSLLVEPTELVFSSVGKLLKERVITGNVEENSPLKGETPVPRRRQNRSKNVLAPKDSNVPRPVDRTRQSLAARNARNVTSVGSSNQNQPSRHRGLVGSHQPQTSYDGEFDMTINAFGKRARSAFDVFSDEEDSNQTYPSHSMNETPKGQIDTLTPTRLLLDRKPAPRGVRPSKIARTTADKENIEPILNSRGRIGSGIGLPGWHSSFAKPVAGPGGFGPHYPNEPSLSGLGGSLNDIGNTGYRSNPLFTNPSAYGNQLKQQYGEKHDEWSSTVHAPASEETIPEDEFEFPGVYLISSAD
ncbi:unnamed protein product [Penicillium salamii]|uniref:Uncharacterized protein n=1 Tax=Penicillium salamii TaxID=1612424 RepID=A0A9W4K0F9_9EURO|nr:unnamed protein product [Penicillium salamii]